MGRVGRLPPAHRIRELCAPEEQLDARLRRRGDVRRRRPDSGVTGQHKHGDKSRNPHGPFPGLIGGRLSVSYARAPQVSTTDLPAATGGRGRGVRFAA